MTQTTHRDSFTPAQRQVLDRLDTLDRDELRWALVYLIGGTPAEVGIVADAIDCAVRTATPSRGVTAIMQRYETGWRSISLYTGASIHQLRTAAAAGQIEVGDMDGPVASHAALDAWLVRGEA